LNSDTEADGKTLRDNSCTMWINALSEGKDHDFRDLPVLIVGNCGGALKQGQYIAPHNKLLTTIANVMGAKASGGGRVTHFGAAGYGADGDYTQLLV
jgi:hypothetical protein